MATVKTRQQLEASFAPGAYPTSADFADVFASFVHQSDETHSTSEDILFVDLADDDYAAFTDYRTGITGYSGGQYEKVGVADVISAWLGVHYSASQADEMYNASKIAVVRNKNFFNTAYNNSPVYIESKGGTITIGSGTSYENDVITAIPSGACVMFIKREDSLWSVIDRPISISEYELSQLAQSSSYGGYGS